MLDAGERIFAEKGYEGASLRLIADDAKLHVALCTYYFGTKENMLDQVIERRAVELERQRLTNLIKIDFESMSQSDAVRALIEAYVSPLLEARFGVLSEWQAFVRMMANITNDSRWTAMVRKHFDFTAKKYIERWREVLPDAEQHSLLNAFSFMVATTLYVCSYTDRFHQWKESPSRMGEIRRVVTADLLNFVHAGFMGL